MAKTRRYDNRHLLSSTLIALVFAAVALSVAVVCVYLVVLTNVDALKVSTLVALEVPLCGVICVGMPGGPRRD
jgi:hypothetical protein